LAGLLGLLMAATAVLAEDLSEHVRADHPDSYTVVRGDTLWDISGRFLNKPWYWPRLWRVNPQIRNPHLIYPGDIIHFRYVDGQPTLSLERGSMLDGGNDSIEPRIREEPLESAIPAIRLDSIEGFLSGHRIVDLPTLTSAPYVLGGESARIILGAGDRFYVKGALVPNAVYGVYRRGSVYRDPGTGDYIRLPADRAGLLMVFRTFERLSYGLVLRTEQPLKVLDEVRNP
jgi:hypothetical protein